MIKAIAFDLDGMVFKEPRFYTEELEIKYGIPIEDSLFSDDPTYLACKRGEISIKEFLQPYYEKWQKHPKFTLTLDDAIKEWFEFARINKEMIEIAKELKNKGIMNFILTNNTRERTEYLDRKYNLSETFKIRGSYDLGVLKSDPCFYQILEKEYGLLPEEVLFFDDKKKNIEYLQNLGFKAAIYHNINDFKKKLAEIGVQVD